MAENLEVMCEMIFWLLKSALKLGCIFAILYVIVVAIDTGVAIMLVVAIAIVFISVFITMIIQNRKYKDNPDDPNRKYDAKGIEIVTKEEEERRSKEFDKRFVTICLSILIPFFIGYIFYLLVVPFWVR